MTAPKLSSLRAPEPRSRLIQKITRLARKAIHGTLSESFRTCGNPGCRCHHGGPKHGPHLSISYRGPKGKTTGYYVPKAAEPEVRHAVRAWTQLQELLQQIAALNKERILPPKAKK